jgi:hypothetical protein
LFFLLIEFIYCGEIGRAFIIIAFVNSNERLLLPPVKGVITIRTPVFGFGFTQWFCDLKQATTQFTQDLLSSLAIIEIEISFRSLAMRTFGMLWDFGFWVAMMNRFYRKPIGVLIRYESLFPMNC